MKTTTLQARSFNYETLVKMKRICYEQKISLAKLIEKLFNEKYK